jgi:glycosyltransferase involved in cell wall biosynthesis
MAKVSVCIPTYNRQAQLKSTLEGLLSQSYKDFEILVCDDGSTDGTKEYLDSLSWPNLRVLHNEKNLNLPLTMTRLFANAKGEYVAIHHDHDPTETDWLGKMVSLMDASPEAGMACCGCFQIDDEGGRIEGGDSALYELFDGCTVIAGQRLIGALSQKIYTPLAATASLFRREAVNAAGGYKAEWFLAADEDIYRRVASVSNVAFCKERLFTLAPRPKESSQHLGGWRSIYTVYEFRKDTTLRYWKVSWMARRWNLCRLSWLKAKALFTESLSAWSRGANEDLKLALAWDRVPPLPTGRPPLPLWGKVALWLWVGILRASLPLGALLGRLRRRIRGKRA